MIPLLLLIGMALAVAVDALFGRPGVIAVAAGLATMALAWVVHDIGRRAHDRLTAFRRWRAWRG